MAQETARRYVLVEERPEREAPARNSGLPKLLKPSKVAELLGTTTQNVNRLCREGMLPYVQVSARIRVIPEDKLALWIADGGNNA